MYIYIYIYIYTYIEREREGRPSGAAPREKIRLRQNVASSDKACPWPWTLERCKSELVPLSKLNVCCFRES